MDTVHQVYRTDRYFTFPAFQRTADYLQSRLRESGLTSVDIVQAPADGKTQVGFWTMPLAWDARRARLEILDNSIPTEQRVLADYASVPASLGMWSGSTPSGGVETEIVPVTAAQLRQPDQLRVKGKLVLTDVNSAGYKWALAKAGALGAVNAFSESPGLADGRQWINAWGDSGWAYTKTSTPLLSFSITPRQHALLRKLLAAGPVRVRATAETRYFEGAYPYVTGLVRGTGDEEVLALAHTSEQGAQDNATGVAAIIEAASTLHSLIENGSLPRPRRAIRLLLMGEMYGSMHYVTANPERVRKTVAAICVDTPAASYEMAGTEYSFHMNPHVARDFTDALMMKVASSYFPLVRRPWHEKPFATGTDTYLAEPMVGIPTVWPYSGSGVETHHNSEDTPDRVDARSLRDLSVVTAAYLYFIASAGDEEARWLAQVSETRAHEHVLKRVQSVLDRRVQYADEVGYAVDREKQALLSVLRLVEPGRRDAVARELAVAVERLQRFAAEQKIRLRGRSEERAPAVPEGDAANIVVRRKRFGTIPLDDLPHDKWEGQPSGAWAAVPTIALYWCDGKRTLAEVARLTQMELGPTRFDFAAYFRFLRKHGYVDFVAGE